MLLPVSLHAQETSQQDIAQNVEQDVNSTDADASGDDDGQDENASTQEAEAFDRRVEENAQIIAKANARLVEELKRIKDDIAILRAASVRLSKALNQDLSEDELKTIRKKKSKDMGEIMLRFQDRINYIEQQSVEFTGLMEEIDFNFGTLPDRIVSLENMQSELLALQQERGESQTELYDSYTKFELDNDAQHKNLLKLVSQQNKILKKQQKTINNQAASIKKLQKNHNALVKQFQTLINQLSAEPAG